MTQGELLTEYMERAGIGPSRLGAAIGLTRQSVYKWKWNKSRITDMAKLKSALKLSNAESGKLAIAPLD